MGKEVLLEIKNLRKYFPMKNFFGQLKGEVKAVDDVSFEIYKGETFGLVGESGCGKSTLGRCVLQMLKATEGQVLYEGNDLVHMSENDWKNYRKKLQIIFQDPYSALNPNWNVRQLIAEPLQANGYTEEQIDGRIRELLKILKRFCDSNGYKLSEETIPMLTQKLNEMFETREEHFGNARAIRNLFEHAINNQANRLVLDNDITDDELMELSLDDITAALEEI